MPIPVLAAHLARMPAIEAAAELRVVEAVAMGTGAAKASERDRRVSELQGLVAGETAEPIRPRTPAELAAAVRGHGIRIRTVKR